jgi:hypothetical protein
VYRWNGPRDIVETCNAERENGCCSNTNQSGFASLETLTMREKLRDGVGESETDEAYHAEAEANDGVGDYRGDITPREQGGIPKQKCGYRSRERAYCVESEKTISKTAFG